MSSEQPSIEARELRSAVLATVSEADLYEVARALVALAKAGNVAAAELLFDRLLGPVEREA